MSVPACFSHYSPAFRSPCHRCAYQGKCSAKTDLGTFSVMSATRFTEVAYSETVEDPQTGGDIGYVEEARDACIKRGFRFRDKSFIVRTPSKHKLAFLIPGPMRSIIVVLDGIKAADVVTLRAAQRCAVRNNVARGKQDSLSKKRRQANLDLYRDGCHVVAPTPDDAAAVVAAVYKKFNR